MPKGYPNKGINKGWFNNGHTPWHKGKKGLMKHTEEWKMEMSKNRKGHPVSEETKAKLRITSLGNKNCLGRPSGMLGKKHTEEAKKKSSERFKERLARGEKVGFQKGHKISEETRIKISKANKGRIVSKITRLKLSQIQKGEKAHNWKGGITKEQEQLRHGIEFRLWRESVFARDGWTCQKTGIKGGRLHPHHIQGFAQYPELRFAIDNGITLSEKTHKEFHKKYGYKNNKEQIIEFLLK